MRRQRNIFQTKEQDKTQDKNPNEMKISKLPKKELKTIVIKVLPELGKRIKDHW